MMSIKRKVVLRWIIKSIWEHNKTAWLTVRTERRERTIIIVHLPIMCETAAQTQCRTLVCLCLVDKCGAVRWREAPEEYQRPASYAVCHCAALRTTKKKPKDFFLLISGAARKVSWQIGLTHSRIHAPSQRQFKASNVDIMLHWNYNKKFCRLRSVRAIIY